MAAVAVAAPAATVVQPLASGCCETDHRVAAQPFDCCMYSVIVLSILGAILGLVAIIIGSGGGHFSISGLMMVIFGILGAVAVLLKSKPFVCSWSITAVVFLIIALIIGIVVAFIGAVVSGICDGVFKHENSYYICKSNCGPTSYNSGDDQHGYCPASDCCPDDDDMDGKTYCMSQETKDTCDETQAMADTFYPIVIGCILGLIASCMGISITCCSGYYFTPTPEKLAALEGAAAVGAAPPPVVSTEMVQPQVDETAKTEPPLPPPAAPDAAPPPPAPEGGGEAAVPPPAAAKPRDCC